MNATVRKWGNSLAIRIPRSVAQDIHLNQGSPVELTVENGRMIVKPAQRRKPSLAQLLEGVTKENRHEAVDWGGPVGREAL